MFPGNEGEIVRIAKVSARKTSSLVAPRTYEGCHHLNSTSDPMSGFELVREKKTRTNENTGGFV